MTFVPSYERIKDIIGRRLSSLSTLDKTESPSMLIKDQEDWLYIGDEKKLALIFFDKADQDRIKLCKERDNNPFPAFMTTDKDIPCAIRLEDNSRNNRFSNCSVQNFYSFSVGTDCTAIISNHTQILDGTDIGSIQYSVKLAYIVSFGNEITPENVYEYLEDLIAYSIKQWRHSGG